MSPMPEWKKRLILVGGLFEILIFSGTILGWTSLKLMLKSEGIYEYKCRGASGQRAAAAAAAAINASAIALSNNSTLSSSASSAAALPLTATADFNESAPLLANISSSGMLPPATLANISLQLNLTITAPATGHDSGQKISSRLKASSVELAPLTERNESMQHRTIVIPFQASTSSLNQSFIYHLLRDESVVLTTSSVGRNGSGSTLLGNNGSSSASLSLFSDRLRRHKDRHQNVSTLEQFIHLYMAENLEPVTHTAEDNCSEQEVTLNLAFSIGSFCMGAAAFIWGFLLERWGLRVVRLLINTMISLGAFLMCFMSRGNDWLLFPAIFIMSLAGVPIRIANMQFSNLYPARRSTIISVYSGAFSASSIIYVIIQHIYEGTGISFFWANFILVILSLLMIPFTLFILPADRIAEEKPHAAAETEKPKLPIDVNHNSAEREEKAVEKAEKNEKKPADEDTDGQQLPTSEELFDRRKSAVFTISPITLQNFKSVASPTVERRNSGFINEAFLQDDEQQQPSTGSKKNGAMLNGQLSHPPPPKSPSQPANQCPNAAPPPLSVSLGSFAYNLHQMWFSWMITYMLLYVGSMNMWTERVTSDKAHQSSFVNLYGLFQVLALVISPLAGLMMDWKLNAANAESDPLERRVKRIQSGFWPLFITSLTLLICVLCHYFDTQEFVYTSIIFVTVYRAFLLAVGSAFLRVRFHGDHFNRLLGIMSSVSAVTSLLQIPLFKWERSAQSNVLYVNIFNTVVAFFVMSNPLYLLITPLQRYFLRKEDQQQAKLTATS